MREQRVEFTSGGHVLVGTLCLPEAAHAVPAALLVTGSGPLDRDANHRRLRVDVSRQLAHALAAAGVASLRYDKRGVGESTGEWRRAGFFDNVDDAGAALDALAGQDRVDASRITLVGHSEGAVLVTALAARESAAAAVVLLAGAASPGAEVTLWQARAIAPTLPAPVRALLRLTRVDLTAKVARNHEKIRATTQDVARVGGARLNARWAREYLDHDPAADLARLHLPVLAITGSKDLQVDPGELTRIAELVPGPVETWLAPDLSHLLRAQPGSPSLRAYKEEVRRPVDAGLLRRVTEFVAQVPARTPAG